MHACSMHARRRRTHSFVRHACHNRFFTELAVKRKVYTWLLRLNHLSGACNFRLASATATDNRDDDLDRTLRLLDALSAAGRRGALRQEVGSRDVQSVRSGRAWSQAPTRRVDARLGRRREVHNDIRQTNTRFKPSTRPVRSSITSARPPICIWPWFGGLLFVFGQFFERNYYTRYSNESSNV